jgi:hypothetical protein
MEWVGGAYQDCIHPYLCCVASVSIRSMCLLYSNGHTNKTRNNVMTVVLIMICILVITSVVYGIRITISILSKEPDGFDVFVVLVLLAPIVGLLVAIVYRLGVLQ